MNGDFGDQSTSEKLQSRLDDRKSPTKIACARGIAPNELNLERAAQILDKYNREKNEQKDLLEAEIRRSRISLKSLEDDRHSRAIKQKEAFETKRFQEIQMAEYEASKKRAMEEVEKERRELDSATRLQKAEEERKAQEALINRDIFRHQANESHKKTQESRKLQQQRDSKELSEISTYQQILKERERAELDKRRENQLNRSNASRTISQSIVTEKQKLEKMAELRAHLYAVEQESITRRNEQTRANRTLEFRKSFEDSAKQLAEQRLKAEDEKKSEKSRERAQVDETVNRDILAKRLADQKRLDQQKGLKKDLDYQVELKRRSQH